MFKIHKTTKNKRITLTGKEEKALEKQSYNKECFPNICFPAESF